MNCPDILHHGAKAGVTDPGYQLLMDAQHDLLIDCCQFQGAENSAESKSAAKHRATEFPQDTIKALVTPTCMSITSTKPGSPCVTRDPKPFWDNEAQQRMEHGNRSSDHRHRRERNLLQRSNRQLPEIHAVRPAAQGSVRWLAGSRCHRAVQPDLWPA